LATAWAGYFKGHPSPDWDFVRQGIGSPSIPGILKGGVVIGDCVEGLGHSPMNGDREIGDLRRKWMMRWGAEGGIPLRIHHDGSVLFPTMNTIEGYLQSFVKNSFHTLVELERRADREHKESHAVLPVLKRCSLHLYRMMLLLC
jgi:hypothetical protein